MRIGLISDTHVPDVAKGVPPQVMEVFRGVDLILHAGDIYVVSVLDELQNIAPVLAARGDDDYGIWDKRVQDAHTLTVEGLTLYVTHSSDFSPNHILQYPEHHGLEKAPDIIVFGHTHTHSVETKRGSLLVNPGSATFPHYQHRLGTVALLDINSGEAKAHIVNLDGKSKA